MNKIEIKVEGIHCESCAATIKKSLMAMQSVETVEVNIQKKEVIVFVDEQQTSKAMLFDAIQALGFEPEKG